MSHSYSGVIRYTSQQQGRLGQARGREQFVITLNDDGSRSLRSHVIIQDPPMVERDVVRVVTPGTVIEPGLLDSKTNNYLVSLVLGGDMAGIAGRGARHP